MSGIETALTVALAASILCIVAVFVVAKVFSDKNDNLKRRIDLVETESQEREGRMLSMYSNTTDTILRLEDELKHKEDRWDAGKCYGNTAIDWDEHK